MFGRRKELPNEADIDEIRVTNGLGVTCDLSTRWEETLDTNWWRDFCQSARHLSDGDLSAIHGTLQASINGEKTRLMTSRRSANCDVLGRLSRLQLAQIAEHSDMPPQASNITCGWIIVDGAERHVGKIILELREINPETFDWELRQQAELEVARFVTNLSDEGVDQLSSVFSQYDNCIGLKSGLAIEGFFSTAGKAGFAKDLGIHEDSSQQVGSPVRQWQVTALGSVMVLIQLRKLRSNLAH